MQNGRRRSRAWCCLQLFIFPFSFCIAGAASPPDDFLRRGNEAFARGDLAAADQLYAAAEEHTADPGLVAFNRAAVRVARGDYRGAEVHYLRALADDAVPPGRRAKALFNRGVCLLHQGGDVSVYRSAVACFEQCLDVPPDDPVLTADARHNLEMAKLLWNQARTKSNTPPTPNEPPPEEDPRPEPKTGKEPNGTDTDPGGSGNGPKRVETTQGPGPKGTTPRTTGQQTPGVGNLPVLDDKDTPQPLSPEDTRALLQRVADRLERDRKATARLLAGPERANVRDW